MKNSRYVNKTSRRQVFSSDVILTHHYMFWASDLPNQAAPRRARGFHDSIPYLSIEEINKWENEQNTVKTRLQKSFTLRWCAYRHWLRGGLTSRGLQVVGTRFGTGLEDSRRDARVVNIHSRGARGAARVARVRLRHQVFTEHWKEYRNC